MEPLPHLHRPGRSRTSAAWSALLVLLLFFLLFFFHSFLLRISVQVALWALQPVTGLTIKAEKMDIAWGKPIHGHRVTVTAGDPPFVTQLTFEDCSLEPSSWWRLFFGDHLLINSIQLSQGKGVIDQRSFSSNVAPFWKKWIFSFSTLLGQKCDFLPASFQLRDISFLLLTEGERYTVDHLSCTLPNKLSGQLTYDSVMIDAGIVHCRLAAGKAKAIWNGKKLSLRQLSLAEEIVLKDLNLIPHRDRIEVGLIAEVFNGLLRADGSLRHTSKGTFLDSASLGQQLPLRRLSHFLGLKKNLSGILREGRLTFRGLILNPIDADVSLRMLADNVRLEKSEGALLAIRANLIGRKISLLDFQLQQQENHATASGEITLPEEWHRIAKAPFLLKLKANIADASELASLIGISWNSKMTGRFFSYGEVHGADNHADGYLNIQGTAMTAYEVPLNSLKLQLLFQGEKTNLTNLSLWSGSDHLEGSGTIENKWPHHYEGKGRLESTHLSEKLTPLLQHHYQEWSLFLSKLLPPAHFEKWKLQGGTLNASWEGNGEATQHKGSFDVTLNNLLQDFRKVSGHAEGYYGPDWVSLSSITLTGEKNQSLGFQGTFTISPQEENRNRILHGNVIVQKFETDPKLFVVPFLIPPGILIEPSTLVPSSIQSTWNIDVGVTTPLQTSSAVSAHQPFETINLHLTGNFLSPTLEGSIVLQHVPIIFPNRTIIPLKEIIQFDSSHPWQPTYSLTFKDRHRDQEITATLAKNQTLKLQSTPFVLPSTLALELGFPNETSSEEAKIWFSQVPYWLREQSIIEPTTLPLPLHSPNESGDRSDLGFTGCNIFYQAEFNANI